MDTHAPTTEAATETPAGRRIALLFAALVVAFTLGAFGPRPWPTGDAHLELRFQGRSIARFPVRLGDPNPQTFTANRAPWRFSIRLPKGADPDRALLVTARVEREDRAIEPALDALGLTLRLPDGREEAIPALKWDEAQAALEFIRRPPRHGRAVLGLAGLVIVLWITEVLPLWVTSLLIPILLTTGGIATAKSALAPFFHPIIALFLAGFLVAEAMERTGLSRRIALSVVATAGRGPKTLFAALIGVSALLSMGMSNTAATAVLVPIALAVTEPIGSRAYRKAAVLGIAYAATIGGTGSAIGTPANPLAMEFLARFAARPMTFVEWFGFGLPLVFALLPIMGAYLWWSIGVELPPERFGAARTAARRALATLGPCSREQRLLALVLAVVMLIWLTQTWHHLDTGITALIGAVALAALGLVRTQDLGRISWASLITFGGGLCLGAFLTETGLTDWIATRLEILTAFPKWAALAAIGGLTLLLTAIASNTATAAMLVPLAIPLAAILGLDPTTLVVVVALASSIDFALVIGTPPTLIAYATGLYRPQEILARGIVLDLIGVVSLVTVVTACWRWLGLV